MSASPDQSPPHRRDVFEGSLSGSQTRPFVPKLRSDPSPWHPLPRNLAEYREKEGKERREARLHALWRRLPTRRPTLKHEDQCIDVIRTGLNPERAERLRAMYEDELMRRCASGGTTSIDWNDFLEYADRKEAELWTIFHDELDLDNNGHLDAAELAEALGNAGITLTPATLSDFMTFLTSSPHSHAISFPEFRDFLLLLPRHASTTEIYRYYEVRKFLGDDGRGAARVNMEGDVSLSAEDRPPTLKKSGANPTVSDTEPVLTLGDGSLDDEDGFDQEFEHEVDEHSWLMGHTARYLLAGGVAGAVSRTATAPFDRLKIFLITRPPDLGGLTPAAAPTQGAKALAGAVARLYTEGGVRAFWVGNGLNLFKIFPKLLFAKHWDLVEDPRDISGVSRFISGGMGGIVSQLFIYPIETLKTQMMSSTGHQRRTLAVSMKRLWTLGGVHAYYRGLTTIGVFPYSAIDMSTFEALKLAYLRSTAKEEPGVLAMLAFGSISGSIGATSVYPLNLVRTRLQASGSSGHPQRYTGVWDVAAKTMAADGWRGFYRGLFPTLAKVVPSVSISYVVYESTKRRLGV
ncbi:mitochondrial carrier [Gautieria morchelliformis]|nr:mitochondrial carrier [Gautieria morchelliformis]